jgi:hypothetical protein
MPARPFEGVLQCLRRAAAAGDGPGASDAELLDRFIQVRDEHAVEDCFQAELGPLQWVAFSPDATWVAFGCKPEVVRISRAAGPTGPPESAHTPACAP